jgi:hypothetical protein
MKVDGRGRLLLPVWLRRAVGFSASLLVGTRHEDRFVVVTTTGVLDAMGDLLAR